MFIKFFLTAAAALVSLESSAGLFRITDRNYGSANSNPAVKAEIDAAFDAVEAEVNNNLPSGEAASYLKGVANSTTQGLSIMGGDPSSAVDLFSLKAQGALGADLGSNTINDLMDGSVDANQVKGFNALMGLQLGLSLNSLKVKKIGFFDLSRSKFFIGFSQSSKSFQETDFDYSEYHLLGQYKLIPESAIGFGLLKWNGIDVLTGIKKSKLSFTYSSVLEGSTTQTLTGGGNLNVAYSSNTKLGVEVDTLLIPIDFYTGVHIFVFDFFTGLGADLVSGKAKTIANTTGPVTATESPSNYGTLSGTAVLDMGESANADSFNTRMTLGTALNFALADIQLIYSKSLSNSTQALSLALSIFY